MSGDLPSSFSGLGGPGVWSVWLSAAAALALTSTTGWVSYGVAHYLAPDNRCHARLVALLIIGAWTANIVFHVLLTTESFRILPALAVLAVCAAGVRITGYSAADLLRDLSRDGRSIGRVVSILKSSPDASLLLVPLAVIIALGWRSVFMLPVAWDTLTYHAVKAGLWVQEGQPISLTAPGGWAYYKNFFGGGEMLVAWAMLPFHSDLIAGLVDWIFWLGLGLAFWGLGGEFGIAPRLRFAGVAYLMTMPAVYRLVGSGYVESSLNFFLFAGLLFVIRHHRCGGRANLWLASAALGMACAVKVTALAYVGITTLVLIGLEPGWSRLRESGATTVLTAALMFGLAWFPWLGLNYREMGFVLGTTPVEVLGFHFGQLTPEMAWYLDRPDLTPYDPWTEAGALAKFVGDLRSTSPVIGPLSIPIMLGGLVGALRFSRTQLPVCLLGAGYSLAALVAVYQPAFSVVRILFAPAAGRFFMPAVAISVLFLLRGVGRDDWARTVLPACLGLGAVLHLTSMFDGTGVTVLGWVVVATAGSIVVLRRLTVVVPDRRRWGTLAIAGVLLAVGLPLLDAWKHTERTELFAENYTIRDISREWLPTVQHTDTVEPLRIAFSSGPWQHHDQQFLYPFLGARLQHTLLYVPASTDGTILSHSGPDLRLADKSVERWMARLSKHAVTHVMSFGPPTAELVWMEAAPERFRRLEGDGRNWGFYEVQG